MWRVHGADILCLHRDRWPWKHLKAVRKVIAAIAERRACSVGWGARLGRRWRDAEVEGLWDDAEP